MRPTRSAVATRTILAFRRATFVARRATFVASRATFVAAFLAVAAASGSMVNGCNSESRQGIGTQGDGFGSKTDGLSQPSCANGSHDLNCSCTNVDEVVSCCKGGTQKCTRVGEFAAWSACRSSDGTPLSCSLTCDENSEFGCDLGTPKDMTTTQTCTCTPGSQRWCDEPNYCTWGKQSCGPDGKWGTCIEAGMQPAGCDGFFYLFYDQECCVKAGLCCQDMANQSAVSSLGNCNGTVVCQ